MVMIWRYQAERELGGDISYGLLLKYVKKGIEKSYWYC